MTRLVHFDIAKAIAIILVVIGHYYPENAPGKLFFFSRQKHAGPRHTPKTRQQAFLLFTSKASWIASYPENAPGKLFKTKAFQSEPPA